MYSSHKVKRGWRRYIMFTGPNIMDLVKLYGRSGCSRLLDYLVAKGDCRVSVIYYSSQGQVYQLDSRALDRPWVIKTTPKIRMTQGGTAQMGAEIKTATLIDGYSPFICAPIEVQSNASDGGTTFSVHAGQSLQQLLDDLPAWALKSTAERVHLCGTIAASILLALKILNTLPRGASRMHRDIKPANITLREAGGEMFAVVIDLGGSCDKDMSDWHYLIAKTALDFLQATLSEDGKCVAAEDYEGSRQATHPSVDMYQLGLCLYQVLYGSLPAAIDSASYDFGHPVDSPLLISNLQAFYTAVRSHKWESWPEVQALPVTLRDFMLKCLAADPSSRFETAADALAHPFLASGAVEREQRAAAAAAPEWKQSHQELRLALCDFQRTVFMIKAVKAAKQVDDAATASSSKGTDSNSSRDTNNGSDCSSSVMAASSSSAPSSSAPSSSSPCTQPRSSTSSSQVAQGPHRLIGSIKQAPSRCVSLLQAAGRRLGRRCRSAASTTSSGGCQASSSTSPCTIPIPIRSSPLKAFSRACARWLGKLMRRTRDGKAGSS